MTPSARGRTSRPTSPRTNRILSLVFVVAGLAIFAWGAWSLVGAIGPRTSSDGQVTGLEHHPGGYRSPETWTVDVTWAGGSGSIDSHELYDALYPLESQPAVSVERSTITGAVLRVNLGGQWYVAPLSSPINDLPAIGFGLFVLFVFAVYFMRIGRGGAARPLSPRMALAVPVAVAALFVAIGLGLLWTGAQGLLVALGPTTTSYATVVAADNNYVDVTIDGSTQRVVSSDLELVVHIDLELNKTFSNADPVIVAVQRSTADGSIVRATYAGQSYDTGPGILNALGPFLVGLFELGFIGFTAVSIRRASRRVATPVLDRQIEG